MWLRKAFSASLGSSAVAPVCCSQALSGSQMNRYRKTWEFSISGNLFSTAMTVLVAYHCSAP